MGYEGFMTGIKGCTLTTDTLPGSRLAVLLPITSRNGGKPGNHHSTLAVQLCALRALAASLQGSSSAVMVLLGIDSDDYPLLQHRQQLVDALANNGNVPLHVLLFSESDRSGHPPGAVCHLWGLTANAAVQEHGCNLAVLLGDDTEVGPPGWPAAVVSAFEQRTDLMLLLLNDAADPGFPSFPVLRIDRHLRMFGRLLPSCLVNQGGDPFLAALYRRFDGCLNMMSDVTVVNHIGGVQRSSQAYTSPRYSRCAVSKEVMLNELRSFTAVLEAASRGRGSTNATNPCEDQAVTGAGVARPVGLDSPPRPAVPLVDAGCFNCLRVLAVDVLVPSARMDLTLLQNIASTVLDTDPPAGADLCLILIVDHPAEQLSTEQQEWLQQLQAKWQCRVPIRINEKNSGASATRNEGLQESLAVYVIMWDDDIKPSPGCLGAYVEAMQQHPQALGFAGPSFVPADPSRVWPSAVHMADVLFFWDAAADWKVAEFLPWAVTANLAVQNTPHKVDLRFPKTGGGEDIDYCLKVTGGKMLPVPKASVQHPLWSNGCRCYNRFFGWASGDGALIAMYPDLCYYSFPSSAEACCFMLVMAAVAEVVACMQPLFGGLLHLSRSILPDALQLPCTGTSRAALLQFSFGCLSATLGFKAVDALLDVMRALHPVRRQKHRSNTTALRLLAATEASAIKTWSEVGRLWGLLCREELLISLCRRFNWFCGLTPAVVAAETRRSFWRFCACSMGAVIAVCLQLAACNLLHVHAMLKLFMTAVAVTLSCSVMIWNLEV